MRQNLKSLSMVFAALAGVAAVALAWTMLPGRNLEAWAAVAAAAVALFVGFWVIIVVFEWGRRK